MYVLFAFLHKGNSNRSIEMSSDMIKYQFLRDCYEIQNRLCRDELRDLQGFEERMKNIIIIGTRSSTARHKLLP